MKFNASRSRISPSTNSIVWLVICSTRSNALRDELTKLSNTTGKFKVGSQYLHLKTDREEIITDSKEDKRELILKVWYPAKINTEKRESYLNAGDRIGFAKKYGLPTSIFNYLDFIETNTYEKPKIVKGKFPVLIFSHGSFSKASGYYSILEEIASHGYSPPSCRESSGMALNWQANFMQ